MVILEIKIKLWAEVRGFYLPLPVAILLWHAIFIILGMLFCFPPVERDSDSADFMVA